VAVASAGPYASLHLAPDRQPRQHPTTVLFTGQIPFLPPNQQRQSTDGIICSFTLTVTVIAVMSHRENGTNVTKFRKLKYFNLKINDIKILDCC